METTFKYKNKIITTPNLEKKLKRMKLSIDDIEIVENIPISKSLPEGVEDYMLDKEQVIICSTLDNIKRVCYIKKGTRPNIEDIFRKEIWNPETKTGLYTKEFIKTMYYEVLC